MRKILCVFSLTISVCLSLTAQSLTTVILPQYIEGINPTNTNRIPYAYRVKITGLTANATYHYFNQIVNSSDATSTSGAGNCIFASATGDFVRTTGPDLTKAGNYGTFTTDGGGTYEGWFITEPTGNVRFVPGKYIFMRIILNDGAGGTTEALRPTTTDSVRVVKLDPAATDSTGTGLRCTSAANPKDFVFTYDNTAGTGRPISGSFIESDGTANTANYASFYANSVNGVDGAFGVVLPNALPNGIRRIERRSLASGAVVGYATDADGVWPSGANTVNPSGGTTEIVLAGTDVQWITGIESVGTMPREFALFQNYPNPFNPRTTISYSLPQAGIVMLKVYDVMGREISVLVHNERKAAGNYEVSFDATNLPSGVYFYGLSVVPLARRDLVPTDGQDGQAQSFVETKRMLLIK